MRSKSSARVLTRAKLRIAPCIDRRVDERVAHGNGVHRPVYVVDRASVLHALHRGDEHVHQQILRQPAGGVELFIPA